MRTAFGLWVIDLGPEGGDGGGEIVAWGPLGGYRQSTKELYGEVFGAGTGEGNRKANARDERGGGVSAPGLNDLNPAVNVHNS